MLDILAASTESRNRPNLPAACERCHTSPHAAESAQDSAAHPIDNAPEFDRVMDESLATANEQPDAQQNPGSDVVQPDAPPSEPEDESPDPRELAYVPTPNPSARRDALALPIVTGSELLEGPVSLARPGASDAQVMAPESLAAARGNQVQAHLPGSPSAMAVFQVGIDGPHWTAPAPGSIAHGKHATESAAALAAREPIHAVPADDLAASQRARLASAMLIEAAEGVDALAKDVGGPFAPGVIAGMVAERSQAVAGGGGGVAAETAVGSDVAAAGLEEPAGGTFSGAAMLSGERWGAGSGDEREAGHGGYDPFLAGSGITLDRVEGERMSVATASQPVVAGEVVAVDRFDPAVMGTGAWDTVSSAGLPEVQVDRPGATPIEQVHAEIVSRVQLTQREGRTDFRMRLDPPGLGSVDVHLTASDQSITARLVVSDEAARQAIEAHVQSLRDSLSSAGVSLERFDVTRDDRGSHAAWQRQEEPAARPFAAAARPARATHGVPRHGGGGHIDVLA